MAAGNSYEVLTQEIFQTILDQTQVKTVEVERDVSLRGKSTTHQIDVYWKFEVGGITHETLIQAKDWNKPVDQGELLKFRAVLDDLPGQPRGVFVSRTGYQSGADDVARTYGIHLFQLQEAGTLTGPMKLPPVTTLGYVHIRLIPTPLAIHKARREGRTFIMEAVTYEPEFQGSMFHIDLNWIRETFGPSADEARIRTAARFTAIPNDVKFFDGDGKEVGDLHGIYRRFVEDLRGAVGAPSEMRKTFEAPTFIRVPDPELPLLKIVAITSTVTVDETSRVEGPMGLPNIVHFILRNLTDGTTRIHGRRIPDGRN